MFSKFNIINRFDMILQLMLFLNCVMAGITCAMVQHKIARMEQEKKLEFY